MVETTLEITEGKRIKYIVVEMLMKEHMYKDNIELGKKIECGLFKGLDISVKGNEKNITDVTSKVILYNGIGTTTTYYDIENFTIVSFEIFDGLSRDIIFYRNCDKDQDVAFNNLADVLNLMQDAKRVLTNKDIIDVDSYENVPAILGKEKTFSTAKNYSHLNHSIKNITNNSTTYTSKRERTATVLKRTSKQPTWEALQKMKEKILQISKSEYDGGAAFPMFEDSDDDDDDDEGSTTNNVGQQNWDDEHNWLGY